jgi:hypothetical protein
VQEPIAVSEQLCNAQLQQLEAMVAEGSRKNLFADLLASDVVQEIETLLGRQAVEDLGSGSAGAGGAAAGLATGGNRSRATS